MAATIQASCPKCNKQLKVPENLQGKKIRCKDCGTVFPVTAKAPAPAKAAVPKSAAEESPYAFLSDEAPAAPPAPPPPPKPAAPDKKGEEVNPYGVTATDLTPRCPHCAKELESEDAVICLHCGYNTRTRVKAEIKRIYDQTGQDKFMWLLPGFVNLFLALFVIWLAWFFCWSDTMSNTWKVVDGWFDDAQEPKRSALTKGLWTWFVTGCGYAVYKCGKSVFYRFIQQPVPPEEELK